MMPSYAPAAQFGALVDVAKLLAGVEHDGNRLKRIYEEDLTDALYRSVERGDGTLGELSVGCFFNQHGKTGTGDTCSSGYASQARDASARDEKKPASAKL
jgi:hypothetical protein